MKNTAYIALLLLACLIISCSKSEKEVVVYTSLDQIYSEPIFAEFQKETGIKVKAVYDTEAAKTVGLVNRLIAEKDNPQADVFWNSECVRTIMLKRVGVLQPYNSPSSSDIPAQFKDQELFWTGFAARCRIIVYNTKMVKLEEAPKSIFDLTKPQWQGQVAFANPLFGTSATHVASLFLALGDEKAKKYLQDLKANKAVMVAGNAMVCDQVSAGELKVGLTDTDDVNGAIEDGKPVAMVYPDQGDKDIGTLVIPNTVAMIANCPHSKSAKKFIDYLLSRQVEEKLANSRSVQMPVRSGIATPKNIRTISEIKPMNVNLEKTADQIEKTTKFIQELFIR